MTQSPEAARDAILSRLKAYAERENSVAALWLQGSLAAGAGDAWSDIDAYLAINDADHESVWARRAATLDSLGGVLVWSDAVAPGLRAVHALLEEGVRLDLFFEKASAAPATARPAVKVLVDKAGIGAGLNLGWQASAPLVGRIIQTTIRMTRQGATWPLRVLGRGLWPTLARMELDLINGQLAQLMAVKHGAANFYRNVNSLPLALSDPERAELADLSDAALAALNARDGAALKTVQLRLHDALVREGQAACAALGVEYPISDAGEAGVRAMIERSWPA